MLKLANDTYEKIMKIYCNELKMGRLILKSFDSFEVFIRFDAKLLITKQKFPESTRK